MPSSDTQWKPGQSGNPGGRPKKADNAVERAIEKLEDTPGAKLEELALADPRWFWEKIASKKLTTNSETKAHVVRETVSEEQARLMAEEYLARASQPTPDPVHGGDEAGLPPVEPTQADS